MFYSQQFLSKKGPLGSIWVAAYCLKRLHRDQIAQTDIPSSVDKILIDEWPSVTYRILGYLLLGVVRIYSKKVEIVLHDCRETINDLNKFVGKKKAVSFREIVHAQDFSVTLPERYELDAFVLELADDVNKAHIARKEDISIRECLRNDNVFKYSTNKRHENATVQGKTTPTVSKTSSATIILESLSSDQNSPESPEEMETCSTSLALNENCMDFDMGASSSRLRRSVEESIEQFRDMRFSREECLDFEMFYQNDTEHFGIHESSNIIQSVNVEDSDFTSMMQTEKDGHLCSEVEDETPTAERNCDLGMPSDNQDHVDIEEIEANFTVQASPDLNIPSSNDKYSNVEDEVNVTDKSPYLEIASGEDKTVTPGRKVTITDSKSDSQSETCAPLSSGKEKLPLNVQMTPDLKIPDVKDPSSTELLAVRTPANKDHRARKANKRKCICDEFTVLSNQTLKYNINDASDLLRKRRRVPRTGLDVWRRSCIYDLPQKFTEPLFSSAGTVMDPKDIQREHDMADQAETVMDPKEVQRESDMVDQAETVKDPKDNQKESDMVDQAETVKDPKDIQKESDMGDQAETVEAPDIPVMAVSPPRIVTDGLTIAPGTPVRCSASTRAFLSPKAADSDGEGSFLSFQTPRIESLCHSFENPRKDFVADNEKEIVLDLIDKDMDQNGDSQELDGWSTRTRTIARWLHQFMASKPKCNEARTANLSQILGGKTRKGSARVFYEILVLGSGEYVNVSQERPYNDILLQETPKMEAKLAKGF